MAGFFLSFRRKGGLIGLMLHLLWTFIYISSSAGSTELTTCADLVGNCDYYVCKAQALDCADDNYLVAKGKKYCTRFASHEGEFSPAGHQFLRALRSCLQNRLEEDSSRLSCESVGRFAERHHFDCYLSNGYCELGDSDRNELGNLIFWELVFNWHFREVALRIEASCRSSDALTVSSRDSTNGF